MNSETKTSSILQRLPVILAVTAASYGLQLPVQTLRLSQGHAATASKGARQLPGAVATSHVASEQTRKHSGAA